MPIIVAILRQNRLITRCAVMTIFLKIAKEVLNSEIELIKEALHAADT